VENELERIQNAAVRKAGKDYPENTSLIIFFDDTPPFEEALEVIKHINIDSFVNGNILNMDLRFSSLYLVGEKESVFREYPIKRQG